MKERPIIFSAPMVRAILAGTKTQTRRVAPIETLNIARHPGAMVSWSVYFSRAMKGVLSSHSGGRFSERQARSLIASQFNPYGRPGDRLWVREAWQAHFEDEVPSDRPRGPRHTMGIPAQPERKSFVFYRADGPLLHPDGYPSSWYPSIHMPRKYSRITLEITSVRVERLQDISEADAAAEGVTPKWEPGCSGRLMEALGGFSFRPAASAYADFCESLHGPGSWDANPWVWVVEFKRINQTGNT